MFADESLDPVEFGSAWRKERLVSEQGCQTRDLQTEESEVQAIERADVEIQTDLGVDLDYDIEQDDSPELARFLAKVAPEMCKQLDQNSRSHAFDGYDINWDEENLAVSSIHTLSYPEMEQLNVTALSWNSTGSVLAASYGNLNHEDWCTHKSALCTWNLDRRTVEPNKPDTVIDLASCLMCISFHPLQPSWILGGTFDGEVIVWDTSKDTDMIVATTGIGDDSHREPVSKVHWVQDPGSKGKRYNICSVSSDGKILIWKMDQQHGTLKLKDGHILLTESLPRSMRVRAKRGDQEMGVTCISFSKEDSETFVIGSESGGLFKCSSNFRGTPAGRNVTCSVDLRSPVTFTLQPHHGPVYSVDLSPYHRNLVLSSGTDTTARIYSMLQAQPIVTIEPGAGYLFSAKWSPVRPLVFAVATEDGQLLLYDLKSNQATPVHKLPASPTKQPVYTLQFNQHQRQLLATGDGAGVIQVWQLSDDLSTQQPKEVETLAEVAELASE
ncbi:unnamed protein product [Owenia fusiformis]|uniref:Uncharacterized protein n=1 Tax=Owenia fusiformis TaxID=6347 RepID=A0A8J1T7H6_OWEFU|nr:unnamed protein product [Owenia fusiformis]